jgi:hypothetical protein
MTCSHHLKEDCSNTMILLWDGSEEVVKGNSPSGEDLRVMYLFLYFAWSQVTSTFFHGLWLMA